MFSEIITSQAEYIIFLQDVINVCHLDEICMRAICKLCNLLSLCEQRIVSK